MTVPGKVVRKTAIYQRQLRMAASFIPVGFISVSPGGFNPAIQQDLTQVSEISKASEKRLHSGNRYSMQRKIQDRSI
ncbi:MAG: hypothetical protein NTW71_04580 [Deltaproteobacteria bacterium]|nr:hypothetical protein [Deltaproteobacteria bacterium]